MCDKKNAAVEPSYTLDAARDVVRNRLAVEQKLLDDLMHTSECDVFSRCVVNALFAIKSGANSGNYRYMRVWSNGEQARGDLGFAEFPNIVLMPDGSMALYNLKDGSRHHHTFRIVDTEDSMSNGCVRAVLVAAARG
jgi:hypothetical protein